MEAMADDPAGVSGSAGSVLVQAAMIHLAVASPGVRPDILPCDIIGRFLYAYDIVQEPLPVAGGVARAIEGACLGVELHPDAITRCRVA